jgi:DNA-binding NarL/FixJ family response regulator
MRPLPKPDKARWARIAALAEQANRHALEKDDGRANRKPRDQRLAEAHGLFLGGAPLLTVAQAMRVSRATAKRYREELVAAGAQLPPLADADLSDRDRQVAELVAAGLSYSEVAARLGVSKSMVSRALGRVRAHRGQSADSAVA